MTKSEYRDYIASEDWRARRQQFIALKTEEHGGILRCESCFLPRWLAEIAYGQDLHVHHENYRHLGRETPEDLEILCRRCHEIETFGCSDLKEIRAVTCSVCSRVHFDSFSEDAICEICRCMPGPREEADPYLGLFGTFR